MMDDADRSPVCGLDHTVLRGCGGPTAAGPPGIEIASRLLGGICASPLCGG